jgi:hypothetical protein
MRLAISGTYSSGKTTTTFALSYLTGLARTGAKTMREILPIALPGKRLEDCSGPELVQLGIRRLIERAVRESQLPHGFLSDGSSLHEWVYGTVRGRLGMNPNAETATDVINADAHLMFVDVMHNFGAVAKEHAVASYDAIIHLPVEFPLAIDGHRPVSETFRRQSDELLVATLDELRIPYEVVGGDLPTRLSRIVNVFGFKQVMDVSEAIEKGKRAMAQATGPGHSASMS